MRSQILFLQNRCRYLVYRYILITLWGNQMRWIFHLIIQTGILFFLQVLTSFDWAMKESDKVITEDKELIQRRINKFFKKLPWWFQLLRFHQILIVRMISNLFKWSTSIYKMIFNTIGTRKEYRFIAQAIDKWVKIARSSLDQFIA